MAASVGDPGLRLLPGLDRVPALDARAEHREHFRWLGRELAIGVARTAVPRAGGLGPDRAGGAGRPGRLGGPGWRPRLPLLVIADLLGLAPRRRPDDRPVVTGPCPPSRPRRILADPVDDPGLRGWPRSRRPSRASRRGRSTSSRSATPSPGASRRSGACPSSMGHTPIYPRRMLTFHDHAAPAWPGSRSRGSRTSSPAGRSPASPARSSRPGSALHPPDPRRPAPGPPDGPARLRRRRGRRRPGPRPARPGDPRPPHRRGPRPPARRGRRRRGDGPDRRRRSRSGSRSRSTPDARLPRPGRHLRPRLVGHGRRPPRADPPGLSPPSGRSSSAPGQHRVVFTYEPAGFRAGLVVTAAGPARRPRLPGLAPARRRARPAARRRSAWPARGRSGSRGPAPAFVLASAVEVGPGGVAVHPRWEGSFHRFTWAAGIEAIQADEQDARPLTRPGPLDGCPWQARSGPD